MDGENGMGQRFNADYYQSGRNYNGNGSSSSAGSGRENGTKQYGTKASYGNAPFENAQSSSMAMQRNDSDFAIQRTVPQKKSNKYNSLDRGGMLDENEVSPMVMKKKANVHL